MVSAYAGLPCLKRVLDVKTWIHKKGFIWASVHCGRRMCSCLKTVQGKSWRKEHGTSECGDHTRQLHNFKIIKIGQLTAALRKQPAGFLTMWLLTLQGASAVAECRGYVTTMSLEQGDQVPEMCWPAPPCCLPTRNASKGDIPVFSSVYVPEDENPTKQVYVQRNVVSGAWWTYIKNQKKR